MTRIKKHLLYILILAPALTQAGELMDYTERKNLYQAKEIEKGPMAQLPLVPPLAPTTPNQHVLQIEEHSIIKALSNPPAPLALQVFGYVKQESIFDTRQIFGLREDQVIIFPEDQDLDQCNRDINKRGQFNMYAIQTRLATNITGPEVLCAESRGYIEADFFGHLDELPAGVLNLLTTNTASSSLFNETINTFHLRHAYLELAWDNVIFWAGQTWSPVYMPFDGPDTIQYRGVIPIGPYVRVPQLRILYETENIDVIGAALGTIGFFDDGPQGLQTLYFRDGIIPNLHGQIRAKFGESFIAAGVDYRHIMPRLVTNQNIRTRKTLNSVTAIACAQFKEGNFTWNIKGTYAENALFYNMIGGYAVSSLDPLTDERTYTNLRTASVWTELIYGTYVEPGIYAGFVKNLGANKPIIEQAIKPDGTLERTIYGLGLDISWMIRVAPRIRWYKTPVIIGAEIQFTHTAFGDRNCEGKVHTTHSVENTRFLLAFYYVF